MNLEPVLQKYPGKTKTFIENKTMKPKKPRMNKKKHIGNFMNLITTSHRRKLTKATNIRKFMQQ